jgi:hypothetical protein
MSSRRRGKLAGYLDDDAGGSGYGFLLTKLKLQAANLERRRHAGRTRLCAGTTKKQAETRNEVSVWAPGLKSSMAM